ncbi:Arabinose 5-phosphate isomerase [Zostera marina]|uniref:Arabinose 5-phosphate isomerase n=1 Tax=Zostera marina TaxID=29655 RepID=A0A0K9PPR1_ZOSMR|nr:Arabinose 5-phosphate isomerase [Zostera marina]
MGSLSEVSNGKEHNVGAVPTITVDEIRQLFSEQKTHINHFFDNLDHTQALQFTQVILRQSTSGSIFFTGVGKSGFVANKISQTLTSLGFSRSSFISPVDALHGDIGVLTSSDLLVFLSKSGSSEELLRLVPCARSKGATLISITSVKNNPLSQICDDNVHLPLSRELCPFDLAPVTSTAVQMLFGDTIAVALMVATKLTRDQYAANHPAGRIGKCLIFKVKDVMKKQDELPLCKPNDLIMDQLVELTSKGCGCLLVVDDAHHLIGTFTDGDLRRTLKASREAIFRLTVGSICNRNPRIISVDAMAVEAMQKMESPPSPVQFLPVVDANNVTIGIVTLHGLVSIGL